MISKGYLSAFRVKLLEQRAASSSVKELEAELNEEVASFPQSWSQTRGSCPRELPATELCRVVRSQDPAEGFLSLRVQRETRVYK